MCDYMHTYMSISMYLFMYTYTCVCLFYTYIYIYIYIYVDIPSYLYVHLHLDSAYGSTLTLANLSLCCEGWRQVLSGERTGCVCPQRCRCRCAVPRRGLYAFDSQDMWLSLR